MKGLIISGDRFEDLELLVPLYRLQEEEGIPVTVASLKPGEITGKHGYTVLATHGVEELDSADYDLLILPGGKAPAALRSSEPVRALAREFFTAGKSVAAICHGPQILISAGLVAGRKMTCYHAMAPELKEAGADYLDAELVEDRNLITSREPKDLPAFCRAIVSRCTNAG